MEYKDVAFYVISFVGAFVASALTTNALLAWTNNKNSEADYWKALADDVRQQTKKSKYSGDDDDGEGRKRG